MRILVSGSTKTVGQLAPHWPDHLGILLTPGNRNSITAVLRTGLPWAIDNGAFSGFDAVAFRRLLRRAAGQPRLLWVVAPDVVGDACATLQLWTQWFLEIESHGLPVAFVLQDGQEDALLPDADCYFVGGSTRFKLSEAARDLLAEGQRRGIPSHMGRVNSLCRLRYAYEIGCDSVDGSGYSRFAGVFLDRHLDYLRTLERLAIEQPLFLE
jgi:hypothetical protein